MSGVDWFKKAIIYHILIDRSAGYSSTKNWDKPIFIGGHLKGIIEKLPYLKKLGVNILWISPFYMTNVYHGYHITDFYKIDPQFGTIENLKELIEIVHENKTSENNTSLFIGRGLLYISNQTCVCSSSGFLSFCHTNKTLLEEDTFIQGNDLREEYCGNQNE